MLIRPSDISDLSLDQRMEYVAAAFGRLSARWWLWPVRGWLFAWAWEISAWGIECAQMAQALNQAAEDERQEVQAAEERKRVEAVRINSEIERRLKEMAAEHRRLA